MFSRLNLVYLLLIFLTSYRVESHSVSNNAKSKQTVSRIHNSISTKILLDRQLMAYGDELYTPWSEWSNCSEYECKERRHRECKDESYSNQIYSLHKMNSCPFKKISEARECINSSTCRMNAGPSKTLRQLENICGLQHPGNTSNDTRAEIGKKSHWPWHISLYRSFVGDEVNSSMKPENLSGSPICSASLLSLDWIVASASCIWRIEKSNELPVGIPLSSKFFTKFTLYARLDEKDDQNTDFEVENHLIDSVIIHPLWSPRTARQSHDAALLKLKIPLSAEAGPICLPDADTNVSEKAECFAVLTEDADRSSFSFSKQISIVHFFTQNHFFFNFFNDQQEPQISTEQRDLHLTVASPNDCQKYFKGFDKEKHLCTEMDSAEIHLTSDIGALFCKNPDENRWSMLGVSQSLLYPTCLSPYMVFNSAANISSWIHQMIQ